MMKLLWIPIALYVIAVGLFAMGLINRHSDEGVIARALAGQGVAIPIFFFALLFTWFFSKKKKRNEDM
ncbi:MAG: hypothetical protein ACRC0Q_01670 [Kurthia gibsonii]|uniref:Uncharacterized protein n=2 Tax=Kurthia gibsonii TaxID=33946 RepID=A0ABU9LH54_9BACL|nr:MULTISPECIES: hypothetical protein [Kurthia]MCA9723787.1 hypothetical protein [Kurthia sp.]MEB6111855.1 hypothetical protein [Kurthia gibsonii]RXH53502.1 hypothetical protein D6T70_00410 [Kurthia gibsonii]WIL39263.1 hypothetical protein QN089_03120 [Kurthia sp. YJT4]HZG11871.1 hypothetical protein [Kurthia gibsonii]